MSKPLKAYMGFSRDMGSCEGACLVFAPTAKEARRKAWVTISDWFDAPWTDVAVLWMKNRPWLFEEADPQLLAAGIVHVVKDPKTCPSCALWGWKRIGEGCEGCLETESILT